jgi:N-acetylmuramate 1-kinase
MTNDKRKISLHYWTAQQLNKKPESLRLESLNGDAGFRRYFRIFDHINLPWLAVDAPPATEDTQAFVQIAEILRSLHLRTPQILAADTTQGFLLVEDLGDDLVYKFLINQVSNSSIQHSDLLYELATNCLTKLHLAKKKPAIPLYSAELLERELNLLNEWFISQLLQYSINTEEEKLLLNTKQLLINNAITQPQTLVHRDFHSRNLIVCHDSLTNKPELGIIDFQGALWGGITYDLVSLLRDCYWRLPSETVKKLALSYYTHAKELQLIPQTTSTEEFLRWFDWMGLQRHIKVLGIFARLHIRDNKPNYLQDLPLVIRYVVEIADAYTELQPFSNWFKTRLLPKIEQHDWYKDQT